MFILSPHTDCAYCLMKQSAMLSLDTIYAILYIYCTVMNLPVMNAVLFPVNCGSALGCGLLVECKHCHIVGCLLHKIIQYKPSSLCVGTYCF